MNSQPNTRSTHANSRSECRASGNEVGALGDVPGFRSIRSLPGALTHATPLAAAVLFGFATASRAQVTERISVGPGGAQAIWYSETAQAGSFVSSDGRFVAFTSGAGNLVPGDSNLAWDVFIRDRITGLNERISVDAAGNESIGGWNGLYGLTMTPDARFVAFYSEANNLVPGDTNGAGDVFLRDRRLGTIERISVSTGGGQGNGWNAYPSLSPDGRFVAFVSLSSNLISGDTNAAADIFVRDRQSSTTERISVSTSGAQGNDDAGVAVISLDARFVAFDSYATNLVAGDTNVRSDIFVRDRLLGTTERMSVSSTGTQSNGNCAWPTISADGRIVSFTSDATNLVPGDTNAFWDVFVRDRLTATTERVSVSTSGAESDGSASQPFLSADGRYIAFRAGATNLVPGHVDGVYARDQILGTTEILSASITGGNEDGWSNRPSISANGRYVVFQSSSTNLVPGDTNGFDDVFLHDRRATGAISFCDPGAGGVIPCPCNNAPSAPGRGCDNSAATGGASLAANGIAYLAQDSLCFTSSGERPSATSVLLQGDTVVASGLTFGQGVRCAGGILKRLYVKTASAGSITAPDFTGGDAPVSIRSAQLGTVLAPGVTYVYLVYYRDPVVPAGCPPSSTHNATQSIAVRYWP